MKDAAGREMAVLPRAEYERLCERLEDAEDLARARRVATAIDRGEEEAVSLETVERMLAGENPMRVWREYRGLTLADIRQRTGLSRAYLSQIETGKRDGTIGAIRKVAETLKLTIDDLLPALRG